ncbi:MAG TPA: DUF4380 domain-containing protein [Candidatus Sulfotelmatobacter sp.]|nr:DUF4380 domain-containing protein [Candidatus Sulfotelmatobacter sp.]
MSQLMQLNTGYNGDWFTLTISNGILSFSVVPSIGGRMMDLRLGKTPVFYVNSRLYGKANRESPGTEFSLGRNYGGSKVWPGPQGWTSESEWPGPPDPVIDCGTYEWRAETSRQAATVHLASAHDEYTGLTMRRAIRASGGSSSVEVLHEMENTGRRPVRWSIWQVTQVDAEQGLEIFAPASDFRQTFGDKPYPAVGMDANKRRVQIRYEDQVAKLAVKASEGWFASLDRVRGFVLAETFPLMPNASYPDDAPLAFWISGHGTFTLHGDQVDMGATPGGCDPHVETEIMGPLTDLRPRESTTLRTAWHLAAIDAAEIVSVNSCGAIGVPLAIEEGSPARVTGSFGVFVEANLCLLSYDRASQIIGNFDLGNVSPSVAVTLDNKISLPTGTVRCSLVLFDREQKQFGVLDRVHIC